MYKLSDLNCVTEGAVWAPLIGWFNGLTSGCTGTKRTIWYQAESTYICLNQSPRKLDSFGRTARRGWMSLLPSALTSNYRRWLYVQRNLYRKILQSRVRHMQFLSQFLFPSTGLLMVLNFLGWNILFLYQLLTKRYRVSFLVWEHSW